MTNPFNANNYPTLAFSDIEKGDTVARIRNGIATIATIAKVSKDSLENEHGVCIYADTFDEGITWRLLDRPEPAWKSAHLVKTVSNEHGTIYWVRSKAPLRWVRTDRGAPEGQYGEVFDHYDESSIEWYGNESIEVIVK